MSNPREIKITILNHDYTATEPRWQSTIDMMKSSTEQRIFKKEGDSRVRSVKSYRPVKSPPSSPTDKSKAHLEAVYRDMHRQVYQVDQDSTEAAYRERNHEVDRMVTEADFQRRLPSQTASTSTDDYRPQDIFYRACESTAQSSDSASALELGKYNHL